MHQTPTQKTPKLTKKKQLNIQLPPTSPLSHIATMMQTNMQNSPKLQFKDMNLLSLATTSTTMNGGGNSDS